jgi:hypothetical protein
MASKENIQISLRNSLATAQTTASLCHSIKIVLIEVVLAFSIVRGQIEPG